MEKGWGRGGIITVSIRQLSFGRTNACTSCLPSRYSLALSQIDPVSPVKCTVINRDFQYSQAEQRFVSRMMVAQQEEYLHQGAKSYKGSTSALRIDQGGRRLRFLVHMKGSVISLATSPFSGQSAILQSSRLAHFLSPCIFIRPPNISTWYIFSD